MKLEDIPAQERDDMIVITHPRSLAEKSFRRTMMGIWWGDASAVDRALVKSAIVVAGEAEDQRITVMRLFRGTDLEIRKKAIEWKDVFLARRVGVPPDPPGLLAALQREDGLQKYTPAPPYQDIFGRPVYRVMNPEEVWPSFRSRKLRASVIPYRDRFIGDLHSAALLVENLINTHVATIDLLLAPGIEAARKKQFKERLEDLAYLAMIGVVWELYSTRSRPKDEDKDGRRQKPVWEPLYDQRR